MKVLIVGGDGMLGHRIFRALRAGHETKVTLRRPVQAYAATGLFDEANAFGDIDVRLPDSLRRRIEEFRPDAVINAAAVVPQRDEGADVVANLEVNALFPHRLAQMCRAVGARLIHVSTDAVFSGKRGNYREDDRPDPVDIYGHCKLLGEVSGAGVLTLRAAIVGLGLTRRTGLVEWFLQQRGEVSGYRRARFSALTTGQFARVIEMLLAAYPGATGLYHVSTAAISKYDLLVALRERLALPVEVVADDSERPDRSLDSTRFRAQFSWSPPSWEEMLDELANDIRARQR